MEHLHTSPSQDYFSKMSRQLLGRSTLSIWISCLSALLVVLTVLPPPITSFVLSTQQQQHRHGRLATFHSAKNSKKSVPPSKSGSGFGAPPPAAPLQGKVRTLSGFSGSGTKPLRAAANTFDAIRSKHGKEACWDLYCKSPLDHPQRLWFVGKIAVLPHTAATPEQAVISQKRIILEYAKRELRPRNLGLPKYADTLELWLAPGDSEMDCVQNKVSLQKVTGSLADLQTDFSVEMVGFNPEIYVGDEREQGGLRILRDDNGDPVKPVFEVNL